MVDLHLFQVSPVTLGVLFLAAAAIVATLVVVVPDRRAAALQRLQATIAQESALTRGTRGVTMLISRAVGRGSRARSLTYALDRAGIRRALPEFLLIVAGGTLAAVALGALVQGAFLAVVLAVAVPLATGLVVTLKADRRRSQFADQLDDLCQLLATNLRAGHSLLQAMTSLASEVEEPARGELSRAVNQVRVGRDIGDALEETAGRMASEDFKWMAQAIAIHRQVGGNLADVLDTVSLTIRERNQVRRQAKALSAEGRMSAWVLMLLPIGLAIVLSLLNPIYLSTFTSTFLGWVMLGMCAFLMLVGGLWLRVLIRVEY